MAVRMASVVDGGDDGREVVEVVAMVRVAVMVAVVVDAFGGDGGVAMMLMVVVWVAGVRMGSAGGGRKLSVCARV
ncbi:hypothetical protein Tco_0105183 [Tanacetum coccineum]